MNAQPPRKSYPAGLIRMIVTIVTVAKGKEVGSPRDIGKHLADVYFKLFLAGCWLLAAGLT